MSVRYSYDNFSTKGHGVIEGAGRPKHQPTQAEIRNTRKNSRPLYSTIAKIPKSYRANQTVTANVDTYLGLITKARTPLHTQIINELRAGYIVRIKKVIIKQTSSDAYIVYHKRST